MREREISEKLFFKKFSTMKKINKFKFLLDLTSLSDLI